MTEYKEIIDVFESEIFTLSKYLEDKEMEVFHGQRFRKMIKALSKAITLAKAFDSVSNNLEMPEYKKTKDCDSGCDSYHSMLTHGCGGCDETSNNVGFNDALSLCKPLIVKRDMEIAEVEAEFQASKAELEELWDKSEQAQRINAAKISELFNTIDDWQQTLAYLTKEDVATPKGVSDFVMKEFVKLRKENKAIKDKMSEEKISSLLKSKRIWVSQNTNGDKYIALESCEMLAKAITFNFKNLLKETKK